MFDKIAQDMRNALREKQTDRLSVLRMLFAALQTRQIEKRSKTGDKETALTDEEVVAVIKQEAKKRSDSITQFTSAGRTELAQKERAELDILQPYLPAELLDADLEILAHKVISGLGAVSEKDFGKIMGAIMKSAAGRASGERVSLLVKKLLVN